MPLQSVKELIRPIYLKHLYFKLDRSNCPREFTAWRKFPSVTLNPTVSNLIGEAGPDASDFVFLPMADWHGIRQRSQHLARGLARLGQRCFYLNPHLGREFAQTYPFSPKRIVTWLEDGILELHAHLPNEPVFHHRPLSAGEEASVASMILETLHFTGSLRRVSLISFPLWLGVAEQLRQQTGARIVYDCHDLLEGFQDIDPELIELENRLMYSADHILFSADRLRDHHLRRNPSIEGRWSVIRNAVDLPHIPPRESRTSGPRPVVGYVGSLNFWFDAEAVRRAAVDHPEWDFILVGPRTGTFPGSQLDALPNVRFIGEVSHDEVPEWLGRFDVATIPFQRIPLTEATNPVKLYEYFACGMPVVSTRLPEVERYAGLVQLFDSPDGFTAAVERAMDEKDPGKRSARRAVAEREGWSVRCRDLIRVLAGSH